MDIREIKDTRKIILGLHDILSIHNKLKIAKAVFNFKDGAQMVTTLEEFVTMKEIGLEEEIKTFKSGGPIPSIILISTSSKIIFCNYNGAVILNTDLIISINLSYRD